MNGRLTSNLRLWATGGSGGKTTSGAHTDAPRGPE